MLAALFPSWPVLTAGGAVALIAFLIGYYLWLKRSTPRLAVLRAEARRPRPAATFALGSPLERRGALRRRGQRVRVELADAAGKQPLSDAWVIDRSLGGLCLHAERGLEVGLIVSVRPVHATSNMPWVQVEVKSCRAQDNEWEVGCQFLRRPSWNMLLLFG